MPSCRRKRSSPQLHAAGRIETFRWWQRIGLPVVPRSFTLRGGLKPDHPGKLFQRVQFPRLKSRGPIEALLTPSLAPTIDLWPGSSYGPGSITEGNQIRRSGRM